MAKRLFTSESVTEGHPDKICDQIADAVLDAVMAQDPAGRVACEVCVNGNAVWIMGEMTARTAVDMEALARQVILDIGYDRPELGFDGHTCEIRVEMKKQSPDIAQGVDRALEVRTGQELLQLGAGDQGMMFGYACRETPELRPYSLMAAHGMARQLARVRKKGILPGLRPDGKTQVTVEYGPDGAPFRVDSIVISAQHDPELSMEQLASDLRARVIDSVIPRNMIDQETRILINPTGRFVVGGPAGDSGLTGRKIIVDTYGGYAHHGGGAFSGKDCTKVDRTAAYYARYAAKHVVAAGLADRCEVQLSYAIGVAQPTSVRVDTFGTGAVPDGVLQEALCQVFDFRPGAMIRELDLRRPIYRQTAAYGHFGRSDLDLPWEKTDRTELLRSKVLG